MTARPICGECSTRYKGVNYSREGLATQTTTCRSGKRWRKSKQFMLNILMSAASPVMLYLMYLGFVATGNLLATMLHGEM